MPTYLRTCAVLVVSVLRAGVPAELEIQMCVADAPGSQNGAGFCEQIPVQDLIPPGVTQPRRIRAIEALLAQLKSQPSVQVGLIPFETNIQSANKWPVASGMFAQPDSSLDAVVTGLQSELGNWSDYQGALTFASQWIQTDVQHAAQLDPTLPSRTRYAVILLGDGLPNPRCAANSVCDFVADAGLPLPDAGCASPSMPNGPWGDSSPYCELMPDGGVWSCDSAPCVNGFDAGTNLNQNAQILAPVEWMRTLIPSYNIGDLKVHTRMLFNLQGVQTCGAICESAYGTIPAQPPSSYAAQFQVEGTWVLGQIALQGGGTFEDPGDTALPNLSDIDLSPLTTFCP
jgi:hypothetical protein